MKDEHKTKAELIKELKFLRAEQEKGVFKDIAERKQAEQALQESENRYKELFNHMSSGVAVYEVKDDGKDFIFSSFNRAAEKIDKVKKKDIIGRSVLKAFPGVKDFGLLKVFQEVWKTGKPQHHPVSLYQDQRITGWRDNYVCKLPSGEITTIYDDITERKQAEVALRLHAAMMNNIAEGINLTGLDDLLIKWTNDRFAKMFGYEPGEMVGKHVDILNAPTEKTPSKTQRSLVDTLKKTGEWHGEIKNIKRDGTPFWCYASVSLFDHPEYGKVEVSVHTDITERKQAQEALQEAHDQLEDQVARRTKELQKANLKLQELDQLKSMFIASMSHELRSPLSLIIGFTDIILQEISGEINQEQRRQFSLVKRMPATSYPSSMI